MRVALWIGHTIATVLLIAGVAGVAVLRDPPNPRPLVPAAIIVFFAIAVVVAVPG